MAKNNANSITWKDLPGLKPCLEKVSNASKWIKDHENEKPVGILIHGPTGSGKSYIKDKLLDELGCKEKETFHINASMFLEHRDKVWSHLFGHKKGAYTGAHKDMPGCLNKGLKAVILDEFEMLPQDVQATLLVYLDTGRFTPLGATEERNSKTHLILLTNQPPGKHQEQGLYRDDLLYRLYDIEVPGLKKRPGDILILAKHYLDIYREKTKKEINFSVLEAIRLLFNDWPGNARELQRKIWEKCQSSDYLDHFKKQIILNIFTSIGREMDVLIRALSSLSKSNQGLNRYSSLFPKSSIYEDFDWERADVNFWLDFWSTKPTTTFDWKEWLHYVEKHIQEGIDYDTISYIRTPLSLKEEFKKTYEEAHKEASGSGRESDLDLLEQQIGSTEYLNLAKIQKDTLNLISKSDMKGLKRYYETVKPHRERILGAMKEVFPHKSRANVQPPLLPSGWEEATVTLSLEQPWKMFKEELERAYWTHHVETKNRKGRELSDATGLGLSSITPYRKKFGL